MNSRTRRFIQALGEYTEFHNRVDSGGNWVNIHFENQVFADRFALVFDEVDLENSVYGLKDRSKAGKALEAFMDAVNKADTGDRNCPYGQYDSFKLSQNIIGFEFDSADELYDALFPLLILLNTELYTKTWEE